MLSGLCLLAGRCHSWDASLNEDSLGGFLSELIRLERAGSLVSGPQTEGIKQQLPSLPAQTDVWTPQGQRQETMASFKKSFESLKGTSQSAAKGVTDTAVQAAQDAVQQVADSSRETANTAAQEASRQTQTAIGKAADKATDTIKEFGHKLETK